MTARVFVESHPHHHHHHHHHNHHHDLKRTAADKIHQYGKEVTKSKEGNFNVDDMLKRFSAVSKAIDAIGKVKKLCLRGGLNLTKFIFANEKILRSIPEVDRKKVNKKEHLTFGHISEYMTFKIKWNRKKSTTGFQKKLEQNASKRP